MKYSIIAAQIDQEYRLKKLFKKRLRQKCIVDNKKQCMECNYQEICEGYNERNYGNEQNK